MLAAVKRVAGRDKGAVKFHPLSGAITVERNREISGKGTIVVVSAGTSDIPVAEEAVLTARLEGGGGLLTWFGSPPQRRHAPQ